MTLKKTKYTQELCISKIKITQFDYSFVYPSMPQTFLKWLLFVKHYFRCWMYIVHALKKCGL